MNLKDKFHSQVRDYFEGNLSELDQALFESYMDQDPIFAEYVQAYQEIILNRTIVEEARTSDDIPQQEIAHAPFQRKYTPPSPPPAPFYQHRYFVRSLAVFTLLIWIAAFYMFHKNVIKEQSPLSLVEVTDKYFEPPKEIEALDFYEKNAHAYGIATIIKNHYHDGNYSEMLNMIYYLDHLDELVKLEEHKPTFNYLIGLCFLARDENLKAVDCFRKVIRYSSNIMHYEQEAYWYQAYAYLKADNANDAIQCLSKIEKGNPRYYIAQQILGELSYHI